jgi:hypothetical protein
MHIEKIAVALPVTLILDFSHGEERIAEIRLFGSLEPVYVFDGVVGVLDIMGMVETIKLFFIINGIGRGREGGTEKEYDYNSETL